MQTTPIRFSNTTFPVTLGVAKRVTHEVNSFGSRINFLMQRRLTKVREAFSTPYLFHMFDEQAAIAKIDSEFDRSKIQFLVTMIKQIAGNVFLSRLSREMRSPSVDFYRFDNNALPSGHAFTDLFIKESLCLKTL